MDSNMFNFPKNLKHPSGVEMNYDPDHILIEFDKSPKLSTLYKKLQEFGLENVRIDRIREQTKSDQIFQKLNNTDTRFWCHIKSGVTLDSSFINSIEETISTQIKWIGPAYKIGNREGLEDLVCPLPNVLLIKISDDLKPEIREDLLQSLQKMGLKNDVHKSKYLKPYYYFIIEDVKAMNAFELKEKLNEGNFGDLDIRFETMPMIKPTTMIPNDTLYPNQWNTTQIEAGDVPFRGWSLSTGNNNIIICILDEGCDLTHPDLNFINNGINLGTMAGNGGPTGNHGTACAGIAAALINNNLGVAGLAGSCLILPLAFQNWTDAEVAAGINFATDNNADVISMSFGQYSPGDGIAPSGWDFAIIDPAIENAFENGLVLVAATGNENVNTFNRYPARHDLVIAVGASDQNDNRKSPTSPDGETWWGSCYADGVSIVAPGVLIPTTDRQGNIGYNRSSGVAGNYYLQFNGTSSATPHVAALAALIKTVCPTRSNIDIRNIIEKTAEKVGSTGYNTDPNYPNGTRNQAMGYGRINVADALREAFLYTVACLI